MLLAGCSMKVAKCGLQSLTLHLNRITCLGPKGEGKSSRTSVSISRYCKSLRAISFLDVISSSNISGVAVTLSEPLRTYAGPAKCGLFGENGTITATTSTPLTDSTRHCTDTFK